MADASLSEGLYSAKFTDDALSNNIDSNWQFFPKYSPHRTNSHGKCLS